MKAIYTRHEISDDDPFGDDYLFFHIFFKTETLPEQKMPFFISLDKFIRHTKNYDEGVFNYLYGIRSTIHGYGPKHSKVLKIINDEGFDLIPLFIHFLESFSAEDIKHQVEYSKNIQSQSMQKKITETLNDLTATIPDNAKQYSQNLNNFQDQLDMTIHEMVLKFFPDLFEKSKKHTEAYNDELTNVVLNFSSHIDELMHDNFDPYWEEKYNRRKK